MQFKSVVGVSWILALSLLGNLEVGTCQVTCGSDEFLQAGSCRPCPQCPDGEQLNNECGYDFGAGAECVPCPAGHYSNATTRHRCWPCTNCNVENKVQELSCTPSHNAECGRCLEGYFQFAGLQCHHCKHEPNNPYCVDWLAQQTTEQSTTVTVNLRTTSSSTDIKHEFVTKNFGQHYIDWEPGTISAIVVAVIVLIIAAACIAKKWECRMCYWETQEIREEPEKQDLGMIEQAGSQHGGQIHDNSNHEDEFIVTTDGAAAPPDDEGARCSAQESQNEQAAKRHKYLDLKKEAQEATADMKLEDLDHNKREDLAEQLHREPSAPGVLKNWRHFACYFKINNMQINNWQGMKNVLDYLESSTHVTVPDIIEAIDSIGRVDVVESFCQSLLEMRSTIDSDNM